MRATGNLKKPMDMTPSSIGDAYMCAGGIPLANETHPLNAVNAALAMQEYMIKQNNDRESRGEKGWELRIGIQYRTDRRRCGWEKEICL